MYTEYNIITFERTCKVKAAVRMKISQPTAETIIILINKLREWVSSTHGADCCILWTKIIRWMLCVTLMSFFMRTKIGNRFGGTKYCKPEGFVQSLSQGNRQRIHMAYIYNYHFFQDSAVAAASADSNEQVSRPRTHVVSLALSQRNLF